VFTHFLTQVGDGDYNIPSDAGSAIVWVFFAAVIIGLIWVLNRTRRRAEQASKDRWRGEDDER